MDEPVPSSESIAPQPIGCPNCGAQLEVEVTGEKQLLQCPSCEIAFALGDDGRARNGDEEQIQELVIPYESPIEPEDELDGMRIRKVSQARRSAIRARTYAVIVLACCLVMGCQLIFTDIQEVTKYGWDRWAILYAGSAFVMAIGATIASRKAAVLHRESNVSSAIAPDQPPHFDELSDGSQRVRNLETMGRE